MDNFYPKIKLNTFKFSITLSTTVSELNFNLISLSEHKLISVDNTNFAIF